MNQHNSQLSITVQKLGCVFLKNTSALQRPHTQAQFELIFVTEGEVTHIVNSETYLIKGSTIGAALPGQKHQLIIEPGAKGFLISMEPGYLQKTNSSVMISDESIIHYFFSIHRQLTIRHEQVGGLSDAFIKLETELLNSNKLRTEITNAYLQLVLLYIRREIEDAMSPEVTEKLNPLLWNFMRLVEKNFKDKKKIAEYAAELSVTPNYLHHIIKRTSGYSPGYHIRQRIMYEAKRKLQHSGVSLKQISYELGFYNPAHFSKLFKSTTGMNFTQFKRINLNSVAV